jgi:hypothetical protein
MTGWNMHPYRLASRSNSRLLGDDVSLRMFRTLSVYLRYEAIS